MFRQSSWSHKAKPPKCNQSLINCEICNFMNYPVHKHPEKYWQKQNKCVYRREKPKTNRLLQLLHLPMTILCSHYKTSIQTDSSPQNSGMLVAVLCLVVKLTLI